MATVDELRSVMRNMVSKNEAYHHFKSNPLSLDTKLADAARLLEFIPAECRVDAVRTIHCSVQTDKTLDIDGLRGIMSKLSPEDCYRALCVLESRISPNFEFSKVPKLLDFIRSEERSKALELFARTVISNPSLHFTWGEDDLSAFFAQIPPQHVLSSFASVRLCVSKILDFTKIRKILENITDKRDRLIILKDLISLSTNSKPSLTSYDLRNILATISPPNALSALQSLVNGNLVNPDFDLQKVSVIYECLMSADHVEALSILVKCCTNKLNSFTEVTAVISKIDRPHVGLQVVSPLFVPNLDFSKISTVVAVIPAPERFNSIKFLVEWATMYSNNNNNNNNNNDNNNNNTLDCNDLRSVLVLLEDAQKLDTLRILKNHVKIDSKDSFGFSRLMNCFSQAQTPTALIVLGQQPQQ